MAMVFVSTGHYHQYIHIHGKLLSLPVKATNIYMCMYEPSVARLRKFFGYPTQTIFFSGMGINSFFLDVC